jgi:hypothetical protein
MARKCRSSASNPATAWFIIRRPGLGGKDGLQSFTAIDTIRDGEPYCADMGSFKPYRRDIDWAKAEEAPIWALLQHLDFAAGNANWGYQLSFGLLEISTKDFRLIAKAMRAAAEE